MKIYDSNGWVNWEYITGMNRAFTMVVGARGTGKTYGLFKYLITRKIPFIYLRRLQAQLDMSKTASGNPFNKVGRDLGLNIIPRKKSKICEFIDDEENVIAVGAALSTVSTIRGFDLSAYTVIVFDECIPMIGERPIKNEFDAFLNFYETVNRNREIEGGLPVSCYMLGNANQLINPYFSGWKFTKTALRMITGGQMLYTTPDKTRSMILLLDSPVSARKRNTALYKNANTGFINMAIDNAFRTDQTIIASKPLREYRHIVSIGEIGIYKHKSKREYYVSDVTAKSPYYTDFGIELKQFQIDYALFKFLYMAKKAFVFESYENEILFRNYLNL